MPCCFPSVFAERFSALGIFAEESANNSLLMLRLLIDAQRSSQPVDRTSPIQKFSEAVDILEIDNLHSFALIYATFFISKESEAFSIFPRGVCDEVFIRNRAVG